MNDLPEDIIWHYFIKRLEKYDFLFVCKYIYNCFWNKINDNKLIMKRYDKIREAYEEYMRTKKIIVAFDRMIYGDISEGPVLNLYFKTFFDKYIDIKNISIKLIYTDSEWNTKSEIDGTLKLCKYNDKLNSVENCFTLHPGSKFGEYDASKIQSIYNIWLAIKISYGNYELYDNNNGWNYATYRSYNWIPNTQCIMNGKTSFCLNHSLIKWCLSDVTKSQYDK